MKLAFLTVAGLLSFDSAAARIDVRASAVVNGNVGPFVSQATNGVSDSGLPLDIGVTAESTGGSPDWGSSYESTGLAWTRAEIGHLQFRTLGTTEASVTAGGGAYSTAHFYCEAYSSWNDLVTVNAGPELFGQRGELTVDLIVEAEPVLTCTGIGATSRFDVTSQFGSSTYLLGKQLRRGYEGIVTEAAEGVTYREPGRWALRMRFDFGRSTSVRVGAYAVVSGSDHATTSTRAAKAGEGTLGCNPSVRWAGIRNVRLVEGGIVTDFTIESSTGYDYVRGTELERRPRNDTFANRLTLHGNRDCDQVDNLLGTREPNEPIIEGGEAEHSVWYDWTAPASGTYLFRAAASQFRPRLGVFANAVPDLPPMLNTLEPMKDLLTGARPGDSLVEVEAGRIYQVAVDSRNGGSGVIQLGVNRLKRPVNDDFANRIALSSLSGEARGNNLEATRELDEPIHAPLNSGRSVWWSWTAPTNLARGQPVTIHTAGSDFNTALAVYQGSALGGLSLVVANEADPFGGYTSRVTWFPRRGVEYQIAVDGRTPVCTVHDPHCPRAEIGNIVLTVDCSLVSLSLRSLNTSINQDETLDFSATLDIDNYGVATTGPLQVRLVSVGGDDESAAYKLGADYGWNGPQFVELKVVSGLGPLAPRTLASFSAGGVVPAPLKCAHVWGVYAVLEEAIGHEWRPIDTTLVLHGVYNAQPVDQSGLSANCHPINTGVLAPNNVPRPGEARLLYLTSGLPEFIPSGSQIDFPVTGTMDDDKNPTMTVAPQGMVWDPADHLVTLSIPVQSDTTNCSILSQEVSQQLQTHLSGKFPFGGNWFLLSKSTTIYPRSQLAIGAVRVANQLGWYPELRLIGGDAGRRYAIDRNEDLGGAIWSSLQRTQTFSGAPLLWTNHEVQGTSPFSATYRAREVP